MRSAVDSYRTCSFSKTKREISRLSKKAQLSHIRKTEIKRKKILMAAGFRAAFFFSRQQVGLSERRTTRTTTTKKARSPKVVLMCVFSLKDSKTRHCVDAVAYNQRTQRSNLTVKLVSSHLRLMFHFLSRAGHFIVCFITEQSAVEPFLCTDHLTKPCSTLNDALLRDVTMTNV